MTRRTVVAIVAESPRRASELAAALAGDESLASVDIDAGPAEADLLVAEAAAIDGDVAAIAERFAGPRVLLGSGLRALGERLLAEGRAVALLAPGVAPQGLRAAIAAVRAGLQVRDAASLAPQAPPTESEPPGEPLTPRELEVFELVAKGLSNPDIAGVLGISTHTAKFHVSQILAKIGAATRAEAVRLGLRMGLIGV